MKKQFTAVLFSLLISGLSGQVNVWTWMKGAIGFNAPVVYGTKGTSTALSDPGGRETPVTFTDLNGQLWLFGGLKANGKGNDLWKYDPSTNQWSWMAGDSTDNSYGAYGAKGIASAASKPGARNQGSGWTDSQGNFWLFGGYGYAAHSYGYLNDLWKYDPSAQSWTWISGDSVCSQFADYGVKGISSPNNKPGARYAAMTCSDTLGNLWLFGGTGKTGNSQGCLNDLWKFNTQTLEWTWMSGDNSASSNGFSGIKGSCNPQNRPGARNGGVCFADGMGNLWLFGGYAQGGPVNDLWKYSITSNQWTWMDGDVMPGEAGVYGTLQIGAFGQRPGARSDLVGWGDRKKIWIYGGYGVTSTGNGHLNDLWMYDISTQLWTWMHGDSLADQPGFYTTPGLALAVNKPDPKTYAAAWKDKQGNLWLFGGGADDSYQNDLWKYSLAPSTFVSEQNNRTSYALFPNPNAGQFSIIGVIPETLNIYDQLGELVLSEKQPVQKVTHQLADGIYYVEIVKGASRTTHKMTVAH